MNITIIPNTYLIRVSIASREPDEASKIVNSVVDAYMQQHVMDRMNLQPDAQGCLERGTKTIYRGDRQEEEALKELADRGNIPFREDLRSASLRPKTTDGTIEPSFNSVTEEQYDQAGSIVDPGRP